MTVFLITLSCVATMLLYAVPGFLCIKTKLLKPEMIPTFSLLLMYVLAPCLNISAFISGDFTIGDIPKCLWFLLAGLVVQFSIIGLAYLILRRKYEDVRYKILTLSVVLGNCGFFGIPLLRAVLPEYPMAVPLSEFFALGMNILVYTVGYFVISGDKQYVSVKQIMLNPSTVSTLVGFGFFILKACVGFALPDIIVTAMATLGAMSTPICMLVIGFRLATCSLRQLVCEPVVYLSVAIKQILIPLAIAGILRLLPLELGFEQTLFVMTCLPSASMILNSAEVLHAGQREAASIVLVSTLTTIVTIPLMMLLL